MPPNLTSTYRKFYEKFSKIYGTKTCIMMLVGKFYELYDIIDVKTGNPFTPIREATSIMNIVLKQKDLNLEAGVPEQSLHKFAQTLTRQGWTVVVIDQVKDDVEETVIDRVPTRILSPGTHIETAGQDRMSVAAIWLSEEGTASSVLDLTTGETFSFYSQHNDDILHMYQVYCVKEVVCVADKSIDESTFRTTFGFQGAFQQLSPDAFAAFSQPFRREEFFRKMFRIKGLLPVRQQLQLEDQPELVEKALCVLLRFVEDHFLQQSERLTTHTMFCPEGHMRLSNNILEQLNMITSGKQRSVLNMLERTHSALGKRTLRERILRPITDPLLLQERWTQVEFALTVPNRQQLEGFLKQLLDLPRLHFKVSEGKVGSIDVLHLFQTYAASLSLQRALQGTPLACPVELLEQVKEYREKFEKLFDEEKAAANQKEELVGYLTPLAGPRTVALEKQLEVLQQDWQKVWNSFAFEAGIPPEAFKLVKKQDEDWVWEGPRSLHKLIAAKSARLTNLEIDIKKSGPVSITCKEFNSFLHKLRATWIKLLRTLKEEIVVVCDYLWESVKGFHDAWAQWLGGVDCTLALASVAKEQGWCKPSLGQGLKIQGLRHPLLESAQTRVAYVKHDVELGDGKPNGWLIYGVNASGKSSLMKATGIACLLAQAGSFVPATSFALRPYDAAFSRIWSQDNVWAGLSSFAVEVAELRDILSGATANSLVLGDEVCSGTESGSATALVAAVLEYLHSQGSHFMFATHLHDLLQVKGLLPKVAAVWHLRVERTPQGKLIYDRRLQPGAGSCSYGLEVAKAMGLPLTLMQRAYDIRRELGGEVAANEAPTSSWNTLIQRQACEVCGHAVVRDLEVHHLQERSQGGNNSLRNLAVLCDSCHDRHHNGEIEVGELVQTSDGLERSTVSTEPQRRGRQPAINWSEEEQEVIRQTLQRLANRPMTRVCTELGLQGIQITPAQLRRFTQ